VRLEEMVAWRAQLGRSIALIGCAPLGGTEDSERALAAGFDDFVAGRSAPREMARRLRAVVRRSARRRRPAPSQRTRYGRVRIEPGEHRLWVDGKRISVTRTELAVMTVLVEACGQSRSRADILTRAWGADALEVGERAVDNVVMRLRRKLPEPDLIVTVRGVGFRLDS
jgi:DNA-binding response OmpR family regulator